jgi:hypothetical protein
MILFSRSKTLRSTSASVRIRDAATLRSPLQSRRAPPFLYIVIERSNHQDERAASQPGRQLRGPSWGQSARIYHVRASQDDVSSGVRAIVVSFQRSSLSRTRGSVVGTCLDYRGVQLRYARTSRCIV